MLVKGFRRVSTDVPVTASRQRFVHRLVRPGVSPWALGLAVTLLLGANVGMVSARAGMPVSADTTALAAAPQPPGAGSPLVDPDVDAGAVQDPAEAESMPAPDPEPPPSPPPPPPPGPAEVERIPLVAAAPHLAAFSGLSTWVDLHDTEISPESQARRAAAGGAQAVFVQTARFNSPTDIHDPGRLGRLIETAHDLGLQVMTWYIPDHLDHGVDLRRSKAAIEFTTPRGDRADAFGLDIEMHSLPDIAERNRRLLQLSAELREWAGPDYPLAAIVLPPLQLEINTRWWPSFPWAALRPHYDVFVPMSYSTFRGRDAGTTYTWNFHNIIKIRQLTGDPNLPIHMAGGIADELPHVEAFVDALRDGKVLGGGLYDLHTTRPEAWRQLRALRAD